MIISLFLAPNPVVFKEMSVNKCELSRFHTQFGLLTSGDRVLTTWNQVEPGDSSVETRSGSLRQSQGSLARVCCQLGTRHAGWRKPFWSKKPYGLCLSKRYVEVLPLGPCDCDLL